MKRDQTTTTLTQSLSLLLMAVGIIFPLLCYGKTHAPTKFTMYVGTYTNDASKGIYSYDFDSATGELRLRGVAAETPSPSFLAIDSRRRVLYAANEVESFQGQPTGSISAFAIGRAGALSLLNQVSSIGPGPASVAMDRSGKYVLTANYSKGNIAVFPVLKNGGLGAATAFVQHHGSSVNPDRQGGPHAHAIVPSPDNRFLLVADLGIDQVLVYPFDQLTGKLSPPQATKTAPGAGPRHLTFDPRGKFVYLINEMQSAVTVFSYSAMDGALVEVQTISTLPADFKDKSTSAEIEIDGSGKYLYASNRGHDSITVFAISPADGKLSAIEYVSTRGKTPRNFAIDPTGQWLIAGNQVSNNIAVFKIEGGRLVPRGQLLEVPSPACIEFLRGKSR